MSRKFEPGAINRSRKNDFLKNGRSDMYFAQTFVEVI